MVRTDDVTALDGFLEALFDFEQEIEERVPGFFDYHALRVQAPESFCERVREEFGSSLLAVKDRSEMTAIDLAFAARVGQGVEVTGGQGSPGGRTLTPSTPSTPFGGIRSRLIKERNARDQRIATMTGNAAGSGEVPILMLNAIGQGIPYWLRLIDELMPRHRVIVFEPRSMLDDQIADIEAILGREGAERCSFVAWCTGPKVAVEFAARHPGVVTSMTFLNATFRCAGTSRELETAYERNSDPLFRAVAQRPAMAGSVMRSLQASASRAVDVDSDPVDILSAVPAALREHVAAPFRSEEVLVNYAREIVDFWAHDSLAKALQIDVPVTFMASEYDLVAEPAMSREAAKRFRDARVVFVPGASHYCLYDRPKFVASLI